MLLMRDTQSASSGNAPKLNEQFHRALKYLTVAESHTMTTLATARSFAKDAVIVGMGPSRRGLFLLTSGGACMVRSHLGQDTVIAWFGAGDLVGEFSYLLRSAGHTLIYATEPVEAQGINETALSAWLASDPGLGLRFYQALAAHAWQQRAAAVASATVAAAAPPSAAGIIAAPGSASAASAV